MRVVICIKEVPDPDAVNNYALAGRLEIGGDGKTLTQSAIPRLINGFDEQAIEAALRLRDAGAESEIVAVSVGEDVNAILKHAAALGVDKIAAIAVPPSELDSHAIAQLLAGFIRTQGGADLVLCGRQASDDDQGVVPALMGEWLGMPVVTIARAIEQAGGSALRITRVTPDGDECVEVNGPAVVTISNELGDARYPTAARKIAARRMRADQFQPSDLGLTPEQLEPRMVLTRQYVPTIQGNCEQIEGASAAEIADRLIGRLRAENVIQ